MKEVKTYDVFLEYYDKIVRSINNPLKEEVDFLVESCIKEYKPEAKSILELACGTGEVARELKNKGFKIKALDINEKMLKKAEKNINKKDLILGDMTNFNLNETYDVILCNYNSICHLLKWEQWQNFFIMSNKHLKKGNLLIFDINTLYEFNSITNDFAQFYNFGNDTICLEMQKKEGIYEWLVKIFKKKNLKSLNIEGNRSTGISGEYELIEEIIKENSFPINKIKKELNEKGFKIIKMIDYHYGDVTAESERVYFICKKK